MFPDFSGEYHGKLNDSIQFNSIQFKQTLFGYNDYTHMYSDVNSLLSDTKKKSSDSRKNKNRKKNTSIPICTTLYMKGIVPLRTFPSPPPSASQTPCFYLVHAHNQLTQYTQKKFFSQYMTHDNTILTKRTLQAHTMEKNIILLLLCSWLLLPSPPVVLLSVHSHVLWQSLYKLNQK